MSRKLYYFNPGHEGAILNSSPHYMPPANLVSMRQNLSYISAWYANNPDDFVLIDKMLPDSFKKISNFLSLPKGITNKELALKASEAKVHLWGQSPQSIHYFEELNNQYGLNLQIPIWNEKLLQLTSREIATDCLNILIESISSLSQLVLPQYCTTLEDIEILVESSNFQLLAKAPYSSSGRGLLWLPKGCLTRVERQILHGILKKQGRVSIEKALNKQLDFAMEFSIIDQKVSFDGYSLFKTNNKGAYIGNYIASQESILNTITSYLTIELLEDVKLTLLSILKDKFAAYYNGCIGVDMIVYNELGTNNLHPCIEINVRDNMGLIAISIYKKYITPNSGGFFYLDFSQKENDLFLRDKDAREKYPLIFENNRIKSGYISLCPIYKETRYRAYLLIES